MRDGKTYISGNFSLCAFVLLMLFTFSVNGQQSANHLIVGVNLATPLGSLPDDPFKSISLVSANTCISVSAEYRRSKFGIKVPVRIPLQQADLPENPEEEWNWYGWYYRNSATNYEVGVLPAFYFQRPDEFFQAYTYFGVYFGNAYSFLEKSYDTYSYNPNSGTYIDNETFTYSFSKLPAWDYQRYSFGAGIQLQWDNGLGLQSDLGLFVGRNRKYAYERYTNYGTTDGAFYLDSKNESLRRTWGVQFGLSLTYRIF